MTQPAPATEKTEAPSGSVLSPKLTLRNAEIDSDEDLTVYGRFLDGKIRCRTLTVPPGAVVTGAVVAHEVRSRGEIEGSVQAVAFIAYRGSKLSGDLNTRFLGAETGAVFDARVKADSTGTAAEEPTRPQTLPHQAEAAEFDFLREQARSLRIVSGGARS